MFGFEKQMVKKAGLFIEKFSNFIAKKYGNNAGIIFYRGYILIVQFENDTIVKVYEKFTTKKIDDIVKNIKIDDELKNL